MSDFTCQGCGKPNRDSSNLKQHQGNLYGKNLSAVELLAKNANCGKYVRRENDGTAAIVDTERQLRKRAAVAAKLASQKRQRAVAIRTARAGRVRVQYKQVRKWVARESATAFEEALKRLRKTKARWGKVAWCDAVSAEVFENWSGVVHGGRRISGPAPGDGQTAWQRVAPMMKQRRQGAAGRRGGQPVAASAQPAEGAGKRPRTPTPRRIGIEAPTASQGAIYQGSAGQPVAPIAQPAEGATSKQQPKRRKAAGVTPPPLTAPRAVPSPLALQDGPGLADVDSPASTSVAPAAASEKEIREPILLVPDVSSPVARFVCEGAGAPHLLSTCVGFDDIPYTPMNVANWLYQVLLDTVTNLQSILGLGYRFDQDGSYLNDVYGVDDTEPACGGQVVAFWGTELGSRREQAMIAWEYDVDLAVFVTPNCDFASLWRKLKMILEPLGLRCIEYAPGFKYRICPDQPLAYGVYRELYHETRLLHPGKGRPELMRLAGLAYKAGQVPQAPNGANCLDLEVYVVEPRKPIKITGATKTVSVTTAELFPVVEGIFGPLRIPLPRTTAVLNHEYQDWRDTYKIKVIGSDGRPRYRTVDAKNMKRAIWPNTLDRVGSLLGGFQGAGVRHSRTDVPWRFL